VTSPEHNKTTISMARPEVDVLLWVLNEKAGRRSPVAVLDAFSLQEIGEFFRCICKLKSSDGNRETFHWKLDGVFHRWYDKPAVEKTKVGPQRECVYEKWYQHGEMHRDGDWPALIETSKDNLLYTVWYQHGKIHRDGDLPAHVRTGRSWDCKKWYQHGEIHRDGDKPAEIDPNGWGISWYQHGKLHREGDKPTVIRDDCHMMWHQNGELHRDNGRPALISNSPNCTDWYCHGVRYFHMNTCGAIVDRDDRLPRVYYAYYLGHIVFGYIKEEEAGPGIIHNIAGSSESVVYGAVKIEPVLGDYRSMYLLISDTLERIEGGSKWEYLQKHPDYRDSFCTGSLYILPSTSKSNPITGDELYVPENEWHWVEATITPRKDIELLKPKKPQKRQRKKH